MDSKPSEPSGDAPATQAPELQPHVAAAMRPRGHRADVIGAGDVGNFLTRLAVVLLSSVNAVLWEVYTRAPVMAAIWAAIAIAFVVWMVRDAKRF